MKIINMLVLTVFASSIALSGLAQDIPVKETDQKKMLSEKYKGKSYSPHAKRDFPSQVLWGDSHLHTGMSFDAGTAGCILLPEDAYRFAKGEEVMSSFGIPVKLSRPLDWLAVTDHSDNMGFVIDMIAGKPEIMANPMGKDWHERLKVASKDEKPEIAYEIIKALMVTKTFPQEIYYGPETAGYKSTWDNIVGAAEKQNDPGNFTAMIGYEWTSTLNGNNLHRNVLYRDGGVEALQLVPYTTTPPLGSSDPMELWKWMTNYEKKTGGQLLAIAHNGNLSNGLMFPMVEQYTGRKLDKTYMQERAKWEPIYEITQIKGDGEAHPLLSPKDEFADYETWDFGNIVPGNMVIAKETEMLPKEYAREALKNGMLLEDKYGTNPYKMGFVGATDSHTGLATAQEDNFFGKHSGYEPDPNRMDHLFMQSTVGKMMSWGQVAAGLGAVWAKDNTREEIFDAMQRKEVYATTGSRMSVRFFGGWEYTKEDLMSREPAFAGYQKGVPMGGDISDAPAGKAPTFMVYALRDPIGGNLDRIQVIKGWVDKNGKSHERVYDVAVSDGRIIDKHGRCQKEVGNTVDVATASFQNSIGASELSVVWTDPDFDSKQKAFYYARVIEIPTPRWTTIDAFRFGIEIPEGASVSTQERAYTSPIWYSPKR
ncbi:DUF3604 domain-containing protein [Carboxylicivirga marina]|uniref:DUF3604 domain-containing protein n=1 Tax=Carboxylicivirga marina TaxID=2800988 RepID=A0ABS1HMW4_9BACT|nr:DUF3604 domain-containing protein [Carboxylicivirga marina]MBK3519024.1 DUF3604 domain-containing protein [Carboxylicivirga marina]